MFSNARSVGGVCCVLVVLLAVAGCGGRSFPGDFVQPTPGPDAAVLVMPDGARLPVRTWLPGENPWAVVLALHGFNDSRDAWEIPAGAFTRDGIALVAPDQRGFGAAPGRGHWPGEAALVDDAREMLRQLRARYPATRLYVMGESMGGAELMRLAAGPDVPRVDGFILLAPAVWSRSQMDFLMRGLLWVAAGVAPGLSLTGAEAPVRISASDNRAALVRLYEDRLTLHHTRIDTLRGLVDLMDAAQAGAPAFEAGVGRRALFLYGGKDQLVPPASTAATWRGLPPGPRLAFYPNGYHLLLRDLGRAAPIGDVIAWMHDPGAPLPSGADAAAATWLAAQPPRG